MTSSILKMTISNILHWASVYAVLLPLLVGIVFFNQKNITDKLMLLLLSLACIPQLSTAFSISKGDKSILYNFYTLADTLIWAFIFFYNIQNSIRYWIFFFEGVFLCCLLYFSIKEGVSNRFFFELVCFDIVIQVIWVLIFFFEAYRSESVYKIEARPIFWFCMGILIYAPSTYFLFAFKEIINKVSSKNYLWSIHDILNILLLVCISIGLTLNNTRPFKAKTIGI